MTVNESLNNFMGLIDKITSVKNKDTFEEFQKIAEILLNFSGTTNVIDALHNLEQNFKSMKSLVKFAEEKKDEELLKIIGFLNGCEVPSSYKPLEKMYFVVIEFLVKAAETILSSEKEYKELVSNFKKFKEEYTKIYIEEHTLKNDLTKNFCKDFEKNIYFGLLQEIESINKKLVSNSYGDLKGEIIQYRKGICDTDNNKLTDYLAENVLCSCNLKLKGKEEINVEIKEQEAKAISRITDECMASLSALSSSLRNNKSKFELLINRDKMTKEGTDLLEKLERTETLTPEYLEEVRERLQVLKNILKETAVSIEHPLPTPEPISLSIVIEKLRKELGKKTTIGKLLEWFRKKYKEKEEIVID